MKYKVNGKSIGNNILETVLYNRGISDIDLFINPNTSSDTDLNLINNIDKGIELIKKHINNNIMILVDSDCDGVTSAAIMYKYLQKINAENEIDYFMHTEKKHGLTDEFMQYIEGKDIDLLIIPDAASNDIEQIEKIYKAGTDILIIDHHEIERACQYGVIINNQVCSHTNKNLTGAGMVLRVCEKINEEYNFDMKELHNLAMIGLIGDTANLTDNEVRNICLTSIKNIENEFIRAVYESKGKDLNELTMKDLSFGGVIPLINAVLRVGTLEEKKKLFKAITDKVDSTKTTVIEKRKLNKETRKYEYIPFSLNEYEMVVEECEKVKKRQTKLIDIAMKKLECEFNQSTGIQFFIIENNAEFKGISGLIAMKLSEKFSQPTIVAWLEDDGCYYGSLRGNEKVIPDFKEWCINTNLFEWVQGHANASGLCIRKENVNSLMNLGSGIVPQEICYEVDYEYNKNTPVEDVLLISRNKGLWGNGCQEPVFVTKNITVPKAALQHSKNTLRFWTNGITYIKFKTSEEEFEELKRQAGTDDVFKIDVIGKFSINDYNNKELPQMILLDYEVQQSINQFENEFSMFF